MIENPQPGWLPIFIAALPGIVVAAFALNSAIFPRGNRPLCTIPAIVLVLAVLPTHVLALASGSLAFGLAIARGCIGAAGYVWMVRRWQELRSALSVEHPGLTRRAVIATLVTLPIIAPTILLNFHDEAFLNGHDAIIAHLQNGTYPPRYLYQPSLPLKYHYAFDLAGAIVTGLLRVRLDHAIDLLTLALWPLMFLILWRVGEHVGGRRAGLLVALTVCYSAGGCSLCTVNGLRTNPPLVSYFFQHPWSIGVPIFGLIILQRAALSQIDNKGMGFAALVCSLILLSLSQAVLFLMTVIALGLTEAWHFVRSRNATATVLLALGTALVGARLIGGFFASGPYPPAGGLFNTAFELRHFPRLNAVLGQAEWNLASFGLLFFGIFGLIRARNDRVLLFILAAIGLIITNIFVDRYNWDIVKFAFVSSLVLAIGAGIMLSDLAVWADTWLRKVIRSVLAIALLWQGVYYAFFFLLAYSPGIRQPFSVQMIRPYLSGVYPVDRDNAAAASFLRTRMGPSEIVYRATEKAEPYAIWAGLPIQASVYPADSADNDQYGLGKDKFAARRDLATISETWFDRLLAEHVTWVVTDAEDNRINTVLDSPEGQRRAVLIRQYGNVRIFHLQ